MQNAQRPRSADYAQSTNTRLRLPDHLIHGEQSRRLEATATRIGPYNILKVEYTVPNCYKYFQFYPCNDLADTFYTEHDVTGTREIFSITFNNPHNRWYIRHIDSETSVVYIRRADGRQLVLRKHYCYPQSWIRHRMQILSSVHGN